MQKYKVIFFLIKTQCSSMKTGLVEIGNQNSFMGLLNESRDLAKQ